MHADFEIGRKQDWRDESHCCERSCCGLVSHAPPSASQKPRKHPKKASDKHLHFYAVLMSDARGDLPHGQPDEKGAAGARSSAPPTPRKNQRVCASPYSCASRPCLILPFARAVCVPSVRPSETYFDYVAKMRFLGSEKTGSRGEFRHSRKDHVA